MAQTLGQREAAARASRRLQELSGPELMKHAEYLAVTYSQMRQIVAQHTANTGLGFEQEFESLANVGVTQPFRATADPKNHNLNRFRNISAYDHSRVVLTDGASDYINANWIPGYKRPKAYIAGQGPVPDSFPHFWRMIWQSKAEVIVMVTREVEGGSLKCHRYWPDPTSKPPVKSMEFDGIRIDYMETRVEMTYTTRKFKLTKGKETRIIHHFAYEAWPDHGVPLTSKEFLEFHDAAMQKTAGNPLVVHCSAGVGRTGTFIAIDILLNVIEAAGQLNVVAVVTELRKARNFMVQTFVQFAFVYRTVLDRLRTLLSELGKEIQRRSEIEDHKRQEIERLKREQEAKIQQEEDKKRQVADQERRREEQERFVANAFAAELQRAQEAETTRLAAIAEEEALQQRLRQAVTEAANDEREISALERQEINEITGGNQPLKVEPIGAEEIESAKIRWVEDNKNERAAYDFDFVLTTTQSRIDALRARGYGFLLADKEEVRAVVQAAKDIKHKTESEIAKKKAEEDAKMAKERREAEVRELEQKKLDDKTAASIKAASYLRKMSK